MSKKNKEVSKLRREVEMLKAQLKYQGVALPEERQPGTPAATKTEVVVKSSEILTPNRFEAGLLENSNPYLKKDLAKSLTWAVVSFGLILAIYFLQNNVNRVGLFSSPLLSRFGL